ncbi:MAG: hypothetical protein HRT37_26010 [Alteromonadaceae bacterium]|nr:hypothetical protein [Alteromonadaceae bacterium]
MNIIENRPMALKLIKYNLVVHLIVFGSLIATALSDGNQFQAYWAIHFFALFSIFILNDKKESKTFYFQLSYLIIVPSFMAYKFYNAAELLDFDIALNYLILNLVSIVTLYSALPFLIKGKNYYLKQINT